MWYDIFSIFYDRALENLYGPFRPAAVAALRLDQGSFVLDLPCGTGHSFERIVSAIGPSGRLLGVDRSRGMLSQARRRVKREGWNNVSLQRAAAREVGSDLLPPSIGRPNVDAVLCSLGLTALPHWEESFEKIYSLLRPGGRFVLFDVYASGRTRQTRAVEFIARADLSRKVWLPLMSRCSDFERTVMPADPKVFGGELFVAAGTRT